MTDTGVVTGEAAEALAGCSVLAIEANHDAGIEVDCFYRQAATLRQVRIDFRSAASFSRAISVS